jgi:hypothetical protein
MGFLQKLFGRKTKTIKEIIEELSVGDLVLVEYKHPKEIGIVDGNNLTHTRLNLAEVEKRKIKGTITALRKESRPLRSTLIEVASYDSAAMPGQLRKFLFLDDEIKEIRRYE